MLAPQFRPAAVSSAAPRPPAAPRDLLAAGRRLARRLADAETQAALLAASTPALIEELGLVFAKVVLRGGENVPGASGESGRLSAVLRADADSLLHAACTRGEPARATWADAIRAVALPLRGRGQVLGAMLVAGDIAVDAELEDALVLVAAHLAAMVAALKPTRTLPPAQDAGAIVVRRYAANDSLFVDGQYLIKGVAGNILWKLLSEHQRLGRRSFTNKELRVDPALRLPEIGDNLEARLILLRRRLAEHGAFARIEKTGRGRFELAIERPVRLVEVA
jgi:hypothetical protein